MWKAIWSGIKFLGRGVRAVILAVLPGIVDKGYQKVKEAIDKAKSK